ncbi:MAG: xanthine dehydrogenase family protein subunit M [Halobacteriaceae archaeon]
MKPAAFEYHRPTTVDEATHLLADLDEDAEVMAGNQSLGIIMSNRLATPEHIVDINRIDALAGVDIEADRIRVGAMTRHRTLERDEELARVCPILPEAAEQIAGPSVRNRGTMGGSVAEADPAGNYPTVLRALDGEIHLRDASGERSVPAEEFFIAYMFTDLSPSELITGVSIPRGPFPVERTGMSFLELKRAAQTYPTVSAAAAVRVTDPDAAAPTVEEARLALAAVADVPLRVPEAEAAVEGTALPDSVLEDVTARAREASDPEGELHADEAFKEEVAGEYARRSLVRAYDRATSE